MEARGRKGKEEKQFDRNITLVFKTSVLKSSRFFEQNDNINYSSQIFIVPDKG